MTIRSALIARLVGMRKSHEEQIESLVSTVTRLINNRANEEMRATFQAATHSLRAWFVQNRELAPKEPSVEAALLEEMEGIRYASTLRASVNRRGSWHNFDYWHGLGFGARRETVARTAKHLTVLRGLVDTALGDDELAEAHGFMRHFGNQIDAAVTTFQQEFSRSARRRSSSSCARMTAIGTAAKSGGAVGLAISWTSASGRTIGSTTPRVRSGIGSSSKRYNADGATR